MESHKRNFPLVQNTPLKSPIYLGVFRVSTFKWRGSFFAWEKAVLGELLQLLSFVQFRSKMMSGAVSESIKVHYQLNMFMLIYLLNIFNF